MITFMPLLIAFLGALFGAYFAIMKSRNERLWIDRYECLLSISNMSENIKSKFLLEKSKALEVKEFSEIEAEQIENHWKSARLELNKESNKLRILFTEKDCSELVNDIQDLDRAIIDSFSSDETDRKHKLNVVWSSATSCVDGAVELSRRKCL